MQQEIHKNSQPKQSQTKLTPPKASEPAKSKEIEVGMISFIRQGNSVYVETERGRIGPYTASQAMAQALGEIRRMLFRGEKV